MNQSHFDFAQARQNMVENQLRPAEVNHIPLIEIMRALPREKCVHQTQREIAYADINIPLSKTRFLTEPRIIARMVQIANIQPNSKIMVIGAGTGYLAALLHLLNADVYAVEENEDLYTQGRAFCQQYAPSVKWYNNQLLDGCSEHAPYDIIFIDGAVQNIPETFIDQLVNNGKIITVLRQEGNASYASSIEKTVDGLKIVSGFYAGLPLLSELKK